MAFAVKYRKKFQNNGINTTYRVDILSEAGGGIITPDKMGADPLTHNTLAASKDEYKAVIGSEIIFEFVLLKANGEADYDALLEGAYREHIVKFYNDDTSELLWQGYLQNENIYKSVFESNVHVYLSATDALKDLSDYEFLDGVNIITGRKTGLQILKLALTNLDTDNQFQYNFIIKCGTKPDGALDGETALHDVTHDTRRFFKNTAGKTNIDNCLTVIEKILTPYSCTLFQHGGRYYIKNLHEGDTFNYTYSWALGLIGKAAITDSINIDSYKFRRGAELSMLPSVKELGVNLLNRNMGDELADINDFSGAGDWDLTPYTPGVDYDSEDGDTVFHAHLIAGNGQEIILTLTSTFNLSRQTDGDYIKLRFNHYMPVLSDVFVFFVVTVIKPSGSVSTWAALMSTFYQQYESPNDPVFKVDETGAYNISIRFNSNPYDIDFYAKDFSLTKVIVAEDTTYADITFDNFYRSISTKGKVVAEAKEVYFGDSAGDNDLAALVYDGVHTDIWNREGETDELPLLHLYALSFLSSRQDFTGYLILDVFDNSDNITPVNFMQFQGKYYSIVSYSKSFRHSWVTLHLRERITVDATITFRSIILTSVDGEAGVNSSYVPEVGGSEGAVWGSITGTLTDQSDLTTALGLKLNTSAYTAADVLAKLLTVDGTGSLLDADKLDGQHGSYYAPVAGPVFTGLVTIPALKVTTGAAAGRILISDADGDLGYLAAGATTTILVGGGAANPVWTTATGTGAPVRANNPVFTSYVTLAAVTIIPDNGTIGQAAGPLITFDNANNYLEITGCYVGVGTTLPVSQLTVKGSAINNTDSLTVSNAPGDVSENDVIGTIQFYSNDGTTGGTGAGASIKAIANANYISQGRPMNLIFSTSATTTPLERMRITSDGAVQEPDFATGWFGSNWQVTQIGDAEFENLIVRGSARFRELIIDQLAVISGSQLLSVARGKVLSIDVPNSKITLDDPNNTEACAFVANDFFWIKNVDIDNGLFSDCRGQITNVTNVTLTLDFGVAGANGAITDISEGDIIVQRGHPTTASRQNMMYTTVSDTDAPFQRTLTGINSLAAFNDLDNVVLQTGNLNSLDSHDIVPATPGYGLYSANVYLSGTIVADSGYIGGVTGWAIATGKITSTGIGVATAAGDATYAFWAGNDTPADAEFSVTHAGALKATSGTIGGFTITATELYAGEGATRVEMQAAGGFWAGATAIEDAPFVVLPTGRVYVSILTYEYTGPSTTTIPTLEDADEESALSTSYEKLKEFTLSNFLKPRTLRIYFDLRGAGVGHDCYARVYKNGSPFGTERVETGNTWVTYWEELEFDSGDTLELWAYTPDAPTYWGLVRNFRAAGEHAYIFNEVASNV